jgi:hypothetical protein
MTARAVTITYAALWAATGAGAALTLAGIQLATTSAPRDALDPGAGTAVGLVAHNAAVALWPLALVLLGWPALPGVRRVGDGLIVAQLLTHGLLVGAALGEHHDTWRYLPHLPLEWLAIAAPAASWLTARTARLSHPVMRRRVEPVLAGAGVLVVLLGAAAIETYLVPVT